MRLLAEDAPAAAGLLAMLLLANVWLSVRTKPGPKTRRPHRSETET